MTAQNQHPFRTIGCEIRNDALTRQLYATDASIYQIEPLAVAFPRSAAEAAEAIRAAAEAGIAVTPRGAGTGLAGAAIGEGLIVDFSRYNRQITDLDLDRRTVRAGAGVVLDQLNEYLRHYGMCFGPDVATSSRATLGGMISNNSSGARAPIYGTTADHVRSVEGVLADGSIVRFDVDSTVLPAQRAQVNGIVGRVADEIRARFPEGLVKRWPGYALDDYLRAPDDLSKLIAGSEGTLAAIYSAELNVMPMPSEKGLAVIFFPSVDEAMQASVELLDLKPAAIEHVDRVLFDQTAGQLAFGPVRALLHLDETGMNAFLMVEFYGHVAERLDIVRRRNLGMRTHICATAGEMAQVWALRKAGLSLLTGCKGAAKPTAGLEDVAVPPERLPEFVRRFEGLLVPHKLACSFYGHAASGLLHVRPVIDLHKAGDIAMYRRLAEDLFALTREFKGSIAGEHGVGIARTEFLHGHLGRELLDAMKAVKAVFDPHGVMNPGKIFDSGVYRIDTHLRLGAGHSIELPFEPVLAFAAKDESFIGNLEQCNGCGGCRKDIPTMCPTFQATGEEIMSTRGRANTIRAVLEHRIDGGLNAPELDEALSNCLACKACTSECPSNVNMALLKAELIHARHQIAGLGIGERVLSRADLLGRLGTVMPGIANATLRWPWTRKLMEHVLGIDARRPIPPYTSERFDAWFRSRNESPGEGKRGKVILWDDCFVRYNEPHIGRAAVRVLEHAGYAVELVNGRACCGRPAFSLGRLDLAQRMGRHNAALLKASGLPILFLEPSCFSMFAEDYRELKIDGAADLAQRSFLFEQFVGALLKSEPGALRFKKERLRIAIHGHCHAKSLTDINVQKDAAASIPNSTVAMLETGCCGMAGAFGMLHKKYDLSLKVAEPLVRQINALEPDARLVACGTSCRHQIDHLTNANPLHIAELLADALEDE